MADVSNYTVGDGGILEKNCRQTWPLWTCIFGNVCGLTSTTLWFLVLLPQVWKNFRRKSVVGLSVIWATANFSASLINLFFVFLYAKIPTYGLISSVYCPILEFTLLIQFWIYGTQPRKSKIIYAMICIVLWSTVVLVELFAHVYGAIEWIAIVLWCIETFPQVSIENKIYLHMTRVTLNGGWMYMLTAKVQGRLCNCAVLRSIYPGPEVMKLFFMLSSAENEIVLPIKK